ncbi:integral membrane protein [Tothia fuscella]|uniref:Integral membrane protein n=1 Tax=Tothia fuscella TaxID=1048955 RepID=A0A9P4NJ03_9PEZI|nr:integral membrane protein [Tothia fuscella]
MKKTDDDVSLTPSNPAPLDYVTPSFPSLYWPFPVSGPQATYLYHATDIWRFTVLWTLLFYAAVHLAAAGYAIIVQWKNWKVIWIVPVVYVVIGGIEAFLAGSVVGGLIGGVYNAGYFRMSTWIPFVWALINTLILILSSFAIQGGL